MSKYEELKTIFTDGDHLVSALKELGFEPIRHAEPVHLTGYLGDTRPETAHIIISRHNTGLGASNDVGFVRENGVYRAIVSQYDSRKFDTPWLGRLSQAYKEKQTLAVAKAKGYVFQGRQVIQTAQGPKVQLRFAVR